MKNKPAWLIEERKIYIRDIIFLIVVIALSIILAEFFGSAKTAVDRIFSYVLFFVPLGTLTVLAHLYYRNRRIRKTGSLRSSLRYRLSIAFLLIAIIPSIPIFFISSDNVEIVVRSLFNVDVSLAIKSANVTLENYQREAFKNSLQKMRNGGLQIPVRNPLLETKSLVKKKILDPRRDFISLREFLDKSKRIIFENRRFNYLNYHVYPNIFEGDNIKVEIVKFKKKDYLLFKIKTLKKKQYLFLAQPIHVGIEKDFKRFQKIHTSLMNKEFLNEDVPETLRLGLVLVYIVMICMAFIFALVIARQISNPIVSLAEATRALSDGELDTRLDIKASGEIGILIDSFNQMAVELGVLRSRLFQTQRMAAWREVARRLAHEIKNPLTPIQLSADRMLRRLQNPQKGNLEKVVQKSSNTIIEQVDVLRALVEEFANFARLPKAVLKKMDLDTLVLEVVHVFQSSQIKVETRLAGNLPKIPLDKTLIVGLLNNLIKNALESIELEVGVRDEQKIIISTRFYQEKHRKYVCLMVEDSGPGIEVELQERIFEPYFSTKENQHGRGLGLSLVQRAVFEHDATINCGSSTQLGGALFTIFFRYRED